MNDDRLVAIMDEALGKLYVQLDSRLTAIGSNMATKDQVNSVYNLLDQNIKEHEKQEQERVVMAYQLTRLEDWAGRTGKRTGIALD
jgi:hypothetical protein